MQLKKIKRDINQLKKEIVIDDNPTMDNFLKFCERYYHRPVSHIGEIVLKKYKVNRNGALMDCQCNLKLYCQLSVKFFDEIHKGVVGNPVKDSTDRYSLRRWNVLHWQEDLNDNDNEIAKLNTSQVLEHNGFNEWFESYWNDLISGD